MATAYFTSGTALAARLREIADQIEAAPSDLSETILTVAFQVSSHSKDEAARIATIDAIAAAFGTVAETDQVGDSYHRDIDYAKGGSRPNLNVFGRVLPPVEVQREELLAQLAQLDERIAARPTQTDGTVDHGHTHPGSDAPCYCAITDAELAEQHKPALVAVEVMRHELARTLVRVYGDRWWVAVGIAGEAPEWLGKVPVGKTALVRADFDKAAMAWVFTDWVEPADDFCSPTLTDAGDWVIGDDTCAESHRAEHPDWAVTLHNAWLHSAWARPTADLGPVPTSAEPAAPRPYGPRTHSIVAGFGGAFCEPCRTAPDDYRCEDLRCSCRCRAADLGPVSAPAAPTTWNLGDPEPTGVMQVASSNAELWDYDEEQGRWSHSSADGSGSITVVWDDLLHDAPLVQTLPTPRPAAPVAVSPERVAEILAALQAVAEGGIDAEAPVAVGFPEVKHFYPGNHTAVLTDGQVLTCRFARWSVKS